MTDKEKAASVIQPAYLPRAETPEQKLLYAEEALDEARAELENVMDMMTPALRIINTDYTIKVLNKSFSEMFGISAKDATGKKCFDVFPSSLCHTSQCRLQRILSGEASVSSEIERAGHDGIIIHCIVTATPFRNLTGKTIGIIETFRDLSLRRQMEAQLFESEERYKALINLGTEVGEAIVMLQDEKGVEALQTFVSDEWPRITGYDKNELLRMSFIDLLPEYERASSIERHRTKMSGKPLKGLFEINIVSKGGALVPVELTSAFTMYRGRRANVAYIRDISERKRAEEDVKKQAILLQAQLDSSIDGIMIVDPQGNRLLQNESVERIWGLPKESGDPSQRNRLAMVAACTREPRQFIEKVQLLANDPSTKLRDEIELVDGKVLERYTAPINGPHGERYGRIWTFHDVTENKEVERALRESEGIYRTLFENTGTATTLAEADTTFLLVNTEFETLSGYSKAEVEGKKKWTEFIPPEDLTSAMDYAKKMRQDPWLLPNGFEMRFVSRDFSIKHVIITINIIPGGTHRIVSIKDITYQKRVEKDLETSRERIRDLLGHVELVREEERKHIASEIHDELGQLLTALKMDVVWLAKRISPEETLMQEKTRSMRQTVDMTIQSVKRISAELRPHVLDNLGISAAIEWQVKEIKEVTGIDCRFVSVPADIMTENDVSVALFRIFQEAITNAVRHSKATKIKVELKQLSRSIRLVVEDNGLGIKHREISDSKSFGLTGIKERARALGGEVEVDGHPGKGTLITAEIPFCKKGNAHDTNIDS